MFQYVKRGILMNYNWNKYGKIADYIEKIPDSEIDKETIVRNTISRMCYHAYHCLLNWAIKDLSYSFQDGNHTHDHLIKYLYRTKHKDKAGFYKMLKDNRVIADYSDNINNLDALLEDSKDYYYKIVEPLAKYSQKG